MGGDDGTAHTHTTRPVSQASRPADPAQSSTGHRFTCPHFDDLARAIERHQLPVLSESATLARAMLPPLFEGPFNVELLSSALPPRKYQLTSPI